MITRCFKTGILALSPGSTSKAGGVRFPDDDEPPGSPTRRDDQSNLSTLIAILEKDGSYLVKVCVPVDAYKQFAPVQVSTFLPTSHSFQAGFLKSHHCYEIVFTVPDVPTLGKEFSCLPSSSPTRKSSSLRIHRINSTMDGRFRQCTQRNELPELLSSLLN